jgi:hypothetical protein
MNAYLLAAFGTGPLFLFVPNKMSYAELFNVHEIFDHTHSILGSITLIQVVESVARKPVTAAAVPGLTLFKFLTVLDLARDAGFWFDAIVASAAGACIFIP